MLDLQKILGFVRLLNAFRQVRRALRVNSEERLENDVEHSYYLGMLAWYIADSHHLALDKDLILKYALVHDIVEVHAGDTYVFTTDAKKRDSKEAREKKAILQLQKEFPEFGDLHKLIAGYEKREDDESRFVYALDKIQPVLNIYLDNGRTWKENGVTIQMLVDFKKEKTALSPEVHSCFDELIGLLKKDEAKLFGKNNFIV